MLDGQPEPTTLAALVLLSGLHENTLRGHLEALSRAGLVVRERAPAAGRGRPPWLWSATDPAPPSEYAELAVALAASVRATSQSPERAAVAAGHEWGRASVRRRANEADAGAPGADVRGSVLGLLDELGFAPEPGADTDEPVRLTRCPLLEAARRDPDIVCGVHLGLVQGAVTEHGGADAGTTLTPFAEPGACLLHLRIDPAPEGDR